MSDSVTRWLQELGFGQYATAFAEEQIDDEVLLELTDADLKGLGIPLGPRKKLLRAVDALRARTATDTTRGQQSTHTGRGATAAHGNVL